MRINVAKVATLEVVVAFVVVGTTRAATSGIFLSVCREEVFVGGVCGRRL